MFCLPETAGPVVNQVRAYVSFIKVGVVGVCGSGLGDVSIKVAAVARSRPVCVRACAGSRA